MYAVACSKIWDCELVTKLERRLQEKIYFITDKKELTLENLRSYKVEKIFFPHWSHIITGEVFNNFECIVFHMTDLPFGRGGSPLQNLIVRGLHTTKISALRCSKGLDTGAIYLKKDLSLDGNATEIFRRATSIIEDMIVEIVTTEPAPREQSGDVVEFRRRMPNEGNLANLNTPEIIYDYIRMLDAEEYPNAFLENEYVKYEFHSAQWNGGALEAQVRIIKK